VRVLAAAAATLLVLAVAAMAGFVASPGGGAPVIFVERISSALSNFASRAGGGVWWVWAFGLGAVAAFNPCGIALLPAYLGLYLNREDMGGSPAARVKRSVWVAVVVAATFTVLFGVMGAVFSFGSSLIVRTLPWAGLGVGVLLIVLGGTILAGRSVALSFPQRLAAKVGRGASAPGTRGYAAFGLAYGIASLGCTLPLFLSLVGTALAVGGQWASVVAFGLYGVGMATAFGLVTVAAGLASLGLVARVRGATRFVPGVSAALLLASGAYVVYYWLSAGRLLLG
jgi:cytochrome c-type biogenesis protein